MTQNQSQTKIKCDQQKHIVLTNLIRVDNDYKLYGILTKNLLPNEKLNKSKPVKVPDVKTKKNDSYFQLIFATVNELLINITMILSSNEKYTKIYFPSKQISTNNYNDNSLIQKINLKDVLNLFQPFEQKFAVEISTFSMLNNCPVINIDKNYFNYNGYNDNTCKNCCEHSTNTFEIKDNIVISLIDSQLNDNQIALNAHGATYKSVEEICLGKMIGNKPSNDSTVTDYSMLFQPTNTTAIYSGNISNSSIINIPNTNTTKETTVMNDWQNFLWSKLRILLLYIKVIVTYN